MLAEHRAALLGQLVALIVRELARMDFGVITTDLPLANTADDRLLMAFSAACTVEQRPKSVRGIKGALEDRLACLEARELCRSQAGQRITNFRWRPTDARARTRRHE
jgi:hypothetical protein